jgi:hypothetical protein
MRASADASASGGFVSSVIAAAFVFVAIWEGFDLPAVRAADLGAPTSPLGLEWFNSIGLVDDHTLACYLSATWSRFAGSSFLEITS